MAFWADAAHIYPDVDLPKGMYSFHTAFEPRGSLVVGSSRLDMPAGRTGRPAYNLPEKHRSICSPASLSRFCCMLGAGMHCVPPSYSTPMLTC